MLKELSVKEALLLLAESSGTIIVYGNKDACYKLVLRGAVKDSTASFVTDSGWHNKVYIEVPDEYRYMTRQEQAAWIVTKGYKDHQMRPKDNMYKRDYDWTKTYELVENEIPKYEYRTIQEIDGKIVYGEPQEFKVRAE